MDPHSGRHSKEKQSQGRIRNQLYLLMRERLLAVEKGTCDQFVSQCEGEGTVKMIYPPAQLFTFRSFEIL